MSTKKYPGPKESEIQKSFFQWLSYYPYIRSLTTHIPNGGSRDVREARNLKAQGVSPGWPDVFMAIPSGYFAGLWIEFKSKSGKLTEHQLNRIELLEASGYAIWLCYSLEDAIEAVKSYLGELFDVKQPTVSGKSIKTSA